MKKEEFKNKIIKKLKEIYIVLPENLDYTKRVIKETENLIIERLDYALTYGLDKDLSEKEMKQFKKIFRVVVLDKSKLKNEKRRI